MTRNLCGVGVVLLDVLVSGLALSTGSLSPEAAAFAAGVSLAGVLLTARGVADAVLAAD